ncbi:hypothetical protein LAJ19_09470 [Deinococcus taeanensis]|uniref:hypothetical protein n=1 Tax=Deinococcus taeanensis TaxID=2737050 RepID=UPI001CDD5C25|nr:hypothetical protein [Deinococcus taeanensis]UBV41873.1 hypothetical protein LAJ19_09470 [Deinococcus taeanensis]
MTSFGGNKQGLEMMYAMLDCVEALRAGNTQHVPMNCPVCNEAELHVFWRQYAPQKAGLWVWCISCRAEQHANSRPPEWWVNLSNTDVESSLLVDNFERWKEIIDSHVRQLLLLS